MEQSCVRKILMPIIFLIRCLRADTEYEYCKVPPVDPNDPFSTSLLPVSLHGPLHTIYPTLDSTIAAPLNTKAKIVFDLSVLDRLDRTSSLKEPQTLLERRQCTDEDTLLECSLEITACAMCLIVLDWTAAVERLGVDWDDYLCDRDSSRISCLQLRLVEDPSVRSKTSGDSYREFDITSSSFKLSNFTTSAYKLLVNFRLCKNDATVRRVLEDLFPINVKIIENTELIKGSSTKAQNRYGSISSPRYPRAYPTGVIKNYTLINTDKNGRVRLVFDDFQMSYLSRIKIYDSNRLMLTTEGRYNNGRPHPVQSTGPNLTILFEANHYTSPIGFKASYEFSKDGYWPQKPSDQSCDKVFETGGGSISIQSEHIDVNAYVDCVWLIREGLNQLYDELYVKVQNFAVKSNSDGIQLEVREGSWSGGMRKMHVFGPQTNSELRREQSEEGFVTAIGDNGEVRQGFYIRLRGYLGSYEGLSIVFSQFYRWHNAICNNLSGRDHHCDNKRCIAQQYVCDKNDHCGDYSDERNCNNGIGPGRTGGGLAGSNIYEVEPRHDLAYAIIVLLSNLLHLSNLLI